MTSFFVLVGLRTNTGERKILPKSTNTCGNLVFASDTKEAAKALIDAIHFLYTSIKGFKETRVDCLLLMTETRAELCGMEIISAELLGMLSSDNCRVVVGVSHSVGFISANMKALT